MARWVAAITLVMQFLTVAVRGDDVIDSVMYHDPDLPMPREVITFNPKLKQVWLDALARPEIDLKTQAALTIVRAHQRGMKGLEAAIDPLLRELEQTDKHPSVVLAVAKALVTIDARQAAPVLFEIVQSGNYEVREIIEPALAQWDYLPARMVWIERINQPASHSRGTVLAIRSLGIVREERAVARLRELIFTRDIPAPIRLEAAKTLGVIRTSGMEADAEQLAADLSPVGQISRQAAASLLRLHSSDDAVRLLQTLAKDPEPAIASVALVRLVEIDPHHVVPLLIHILDNPDANIRGLGVEVLGRLPTKDFIRRLADFLNDPHPDVRIQARIALHQLASRDDFRSFVRHEGMRILGMPNWQGLEQATILLTQLDHKPAAGRLADLLLHERPEVYVTAAWGLRVLAVPESLPAAFEYLKAREKNMQVGRSNGQLETIDLQLSQIAQYLGQGRYRPADEVLRRAIPPNSPLGPETRAAAAWALGLLHEGDPVPAIASVLAGRIRAVMPFDVEDGRVRRMSAITLGRMKAADELDTLRQFYRPQRPSFDVVSNSCGWAIEQITGEKMPSAETIERPQVGWFLNPLTRLP
jgi:HEAT repeat protein